MISEIATITTLFSILNFKNQQKPSSKNYHEGNLYEFMYKKNFFYPYVVILNPQCFLIDRGLWGYTGLGHLMNLLLNETYELGKETSELLGEVVPITDFLSNKCLFMCWHLETYDKHYLLEKLDEILDNHNYHHENYQIFNANESTIAMAEFLKTKKIYNVSNFTDIGQSCEEFLRNSTGEIRRIGEDR